MLARLSVAAAFVVLVGLPAQAQLFDEAVVDVGNVGLTVTNAGFVGNPGIRNNPDGLPSFEYPLDSGIEHLFEAGLWVGARRADGVRHRPHGLPSRTSGGYQPGAAGYEFAAGASFIHRALLAPDLPSFSPQAVSQQDFLTAFTDTARVRARHAHPDAGPAGPPRPRRPRSGRTPGASPSPSTS